VFLYFGTTIFKNMSASTGVDAGMFAADRHWRGERPVHGRRIATVDKWGRKPLMFLGTAGMGIGLLAMGIMAQNIADPSTVSGWMLLFIIIYVRLLWSFRRPRDLGDIVRDLSHRRARARPRAGYVLLVDGRLRGHANLPDDGRQGLMVRATLQPCLPFYIYAVFCLALDPGGVVPRP